MASALSLIKAAVSDRTVPGSQILSAILALEKSKQPVRTAGLYCAYNKLSSAPPINVPECTSLVGG